MLLFDNDLIALKLIFPYHVIFVAYIHPHARPLESAAGTSPVERFVIYTANTLKNQLKRGIIAAGAAVALSSRVATTWE